MSLHFAIRTRPNGAAQDERLFRILLVEDDAANREVLTKLLKKQIAEKITLAKVEIDAVATLEAGLALADTANCTILDLNLPDSESTNTITSIPRFRPPVIVITGDDDLDVAKACKTMGATKVFVKGQINGLCSAVIDCLVEDLLRLNGVLTPHGQQTYPQ